MVYLFTIIPSQGEFGMFELNTMKHTNTLALGQLDNCGGLLGRGDDYHYHARRQLVCRSMKTKGDDAIIGWVMTLSFVWFEKNPDGSDIRIKVH